MQDRSSNISYKVPRSTGSLGRSLIVLRAFIDGQEDWGVRELASALERPGSSIHRILKSLRKEGLVEWDPGTQRYRAGIEFHRWAAVLGSRLPLARVATSVLAELAAATSESCWLGIYDPVRGCHAYIMDEPGKHSLRHHAPIGTQTPLWETAGGLAVLAALPSGEQSATLKEAQKHLLAHHYLALLDTLENIGKKKYALVRDPHSESPTTIASAVLDSRDQPVGSITLAVPNYRYQPDSDQLVGPLVTGHASKLSQLLGSRLLGGAGAGTWHVGAAAIADMLREHVQGIHTYSGQPGGDAVIINLQEGRGAYGLAVAASLSAAWRGEAPFHKKHDKLRAVCSLFPLYLHIVAHPRFSGLRFEDLPQLRVSAGRSGFTTASLFAKLLEHAGLSAKSFERAGGALIELDYAEANREYVAGRVDVVVALGGLGDPGYQSISANPGLQLISLDERFIDDFIKSNPGYEKSHIPADTYPGLSRSALTIVSPTVLVTTADRRDVEVYSVIETIIEKRAELAKSATVFSDLEHKQFFSGIDIPLHPGAEKYKRLAEIE